MLYVCDQFVSNITLMLDLETVEILFVVLEDFGDYTDPEAFEVWGRSLMKVDDYQTAQKKIKLAVENAKVIHEKPYIHYSKSV